GLAPLSTHAYRVRAVDNAGNVSPDSNAASATTGNEVTAPSTPTGLTATAVSSTQINLAWNASTDTGGSGLAGYRVFRDSNPTPLVTVVATNYTDNSVAAATQYSYVVRAFDGAG